MTGQAAQHGTAVLHIQQARSPLKGGERLCAARQTNAPMHMCCE
jgi:hypothetical protein